MIHDLFMPALSSTMTEGKIVEWLKQPGDKIAKNETVAVVESDKADMDVESFYDGYLATILVEAGQEAPVGDAIALIAETEAEIEQAKKQGSSGGSQTQPQPQAETKTPQTENSTATPPADNTVTSTNRGNGRVIVSPRARKLAKELNVELKDLQGSGPHGRIVAEDVEKAAGKTTTTPTEAPTPTPQVSPPQPSTAVAPTSVPVPTTAAQPGETVPLNTMQKAVMQGMMASLSVPVFRASYSITTDALDQLYQQIKPKGVTMSALLAKAVAATLQKHPLINASYTDARIKYNAEINIAVAVAMNDGGLITPVLRKADTQDIYSLSRSWKDLVNRARVKQLQPEEYNTGTFTISNLGMYGVDTFDAILPPGQGSILAIGAARPQIVATSDGMMGIRRVMNVNITCDHRHIYGAQAAAFLQELAQLIETNPQSLTL